MGARYDQVEPHVGIVRVPLEEDLTFDSNGELGPLGVSINSNGNLVIGDGGSTGIRGVLIKNIPVLPGGLLGTTVPVNGWMGGKAGDIMDVMVQGEIVDLDPDVFPAGSNIYAASNGELSTTDTGVPVGFTVEAGRLFVNVNAEPGESSGS